jgi:hypothetical protein
MLWIFSQKDEEREGLSIVHREVQRTVLSTFYLHLSPRSHLHPANKQQ